MPYSHTPVYLPIDFGTKKMGADNAINDGCTNSDTQESVITPSLDGQNKSSNVTLTDNNLRFQIGGGNDGVKGNFGLSSGKWYFECHVEGNGPVVGMCTFDSTNTTSNGAFEVGCTYSSYDGKTRLNGATAASYGNSLAAQDVLGIAVDLDNYAIYFAKNNTYQNSGDPTSGASKTGARALTSGGTYTWCAARDTTSDIGNLRFDSGTWKYDAPVGYSAITSTVTGIGNLATWNPLAKLSTTLSEGNTKYTRSGYPSSVMCTHFAHTSGKYFCEATLTRADTVFLGVKPINAQTLGNGSVSSPWNEQQNLYFAYLSNDAGGGNIVSPETAGQIADQSAPSKYSVSSGDTVGCLLNLDDYNVRWYKLTNGAWVQIGNNAANATVPLYPTGQSWTFVARGTSSGDALDANFGQRPFSATPPDSAVPLSTQNLPAPTITKPSDFFKAIIYEGTGAELSTGDTGVEALDFKPDFVWIKNRDTTDAHMLYDSVREATKDLHPSTADQESTTAQTLKSFDANGFTLGTDVQVNTSSENYVAWCLKAGGAPTTDNDNTSGAMDDGSVFKGGVVQSSYTPSGSPSNYPKKMSIASHGGFSIIEYTGTGANATVPHGLDRTPDHIMLKPLTQNHSWAGYHSAMGTGSGNDKVNRWDGTTIGDQGGAAWQNNPFQTEHVITFGSQTGQNQDTIPHIMYVWAKTPGLIGIGSYVGNGADDGPYVVVDDGASGFRPAFVYTKRIDHNSGDWWISDSARTPFNTMSKAIYIDNQAEEDANDNRIDFTANGFKLRDDSARRNTTGTYMYLAFAEDPFGGSGLDQAKAR